MEDDEKIMRERLSLAIKASAMPRRGLARIAGIDEGTVRKAENCGNITTESLYAICRALGISVSHLITSEQAPEPPHISDPDIREAAEMMKTMSAKKRQRALGAIQSIQMGYDGNKKAS